MHTAHAEALKKKAFASVERMREKEDWWMKHLAKPKGDVSTMVAAIDCETEDRQNHQKLVENQQNITKAKNDNFEKREKLAPQNLESQNITKAKNDSFEKREKLATQNFESRKMPQAFYQRS